MMGTSDQKMRLKMDCQQSADGWNIFISTEAIRTMLRNPTMLCCISPRTFCTQECIPSSRRCNI